MPFDLPVMSRLRNAIFGADPGSTDSAAGLEGQELAGRFRIIRRIGSGGMGSVYLARQTSMDRDVAIKVLNRDKTRDDEARARFRIEAAAVSRLRSPHTITVYDFGEDEHGELFLVMELLEGRPLSHILADAGSLDPAVVVTIADQILDSLAEAHAAGVFHRDLKPENIFVKENADHELFVKVLDFGIAKVMSSPIPSMTWPGVVFGTPAYMSPEQVMGREADQRSDLYALAVMMFELLTGRLPISGKTPIEIGVRKVRMKPPTLEVANPDRVYPPGATDFLLKALSANPDGRPANAQDFRKLMHEAFGVPGKAGTEAPGKSARKGPGSGTHVLVATDETVKPGWEYDGDRDETTRPIRVQGRTAVPSTPAQPQAPAAESVTSAAAPLSSFDRRNGRRIPRLVSVRCFYNGAEFLATSADLSATGGFINSSRLPVVGHRLTVTFACPGTRDYNISILAEVTRIEPGYGAPDDIRGFSVKWLRLKARGQLSCVTRFLNSTIGAEINTHLPESTSSSVWEYLFEESKFV